MTTIPNPGSKKAREQGCLCPVVDNEFGKGYLGCGDSYGFIANEYCPLHGAGTVGSAKPWSFANQLKSAIKRFKHKQGDVAKMLGISDSSLSRIVHGHQTALATKLEREIRLYTRYGRIDELVTQEDLKHREETVERPTYSKEAMEFTKIHYIRDDCYNPIGSLVAVLVPASSSPDSPLMVAIGLAMCNIKHDNFVKKIGRELAIARAKEHWKEYEFVNHQTSYYQDVSTEVSNFISECADYYKGKSIILPKIIFV